MSHGKLFYDTRNLCYIGGKYASLYLHFFCQFKIISSYWYVGNATTTKYYITTIATQDPRS